MALEIAGEDKKRQVTWVYVVSWGERKGDAVEDRLEVFSSLAKADVWAKEINRTPGTVWVEGPLKKGIV